MDKYEFNIKTEQIKKLIRKKEYTQAAKIADTIDFGKVKNNALLITVADVYEVIGDFDSARDILEIAYERSQLGRQIAFRLARISVKRKDLESALDYYEDFKTIAPKDASCYILQYEISKLKNEPIENQIDILEKYVEDDMDDKWTYELAKLNHKAGNTDRCIELCDTIILWFSEGKYVDKAMELKMLHAPLTKSQQEKYDKRWEKEAEEINVEDIKLKEVSVDNKYDTYNIQAEIAKSMVELFGEVTPENETDDEPIDNDDIFKPEEEKKESTVVREIVPEAEKTKIIPSREIIKEIAGGLGGSNILKEKGNNAEIPVNTDDEQIEGQMTIDELLGGIYKPVEEDVPKEAENINVEEATDTYSEEIFAEDPVSLEEVEELEEISDIDTVDYIDDTEYIEDEPENTDETLVESEGEDVIEYGENAEDIITLEEAEDEFLEEDSNIIEEEIEDMGFRSDEEISKTKELALDALEELLTGSVDDTENVEQQTDTADTTYISEEDMEDSSAADGGSDISADNEDISVEDSDSDVSADNEDISVEDSGSDVSADTEDLGITDSIDEKTENTNESENAEISGNIEEAEDTEESEAAEKAEEIENTEETENVENAEEADNNEEVENTDKQQEETQSDDNTDNKASEKPDKSTEKTASDKSQKLDIKTLIKEFIEKYSGVEGLDKQVIKVLQSMLKGSVDKNDYVYIMGDVKSGKTTLAMEIIKLMGVIREKGTKKIAKVNGTSFTEKNISTFVSKLGECDVVIEKSASIEAELFEELLQVLNEDPVKRIVIFEDERTMSEKYMAENKAVCEKFDNIIKLKHNKIRDWAKIAVDYAEQKGYAIDEMGMLALHEKIDQLYTITLVIHKNHVEQLIDIAIDNAERKSIGKLIKSLFGNKDKEKILTEADFIND